MDQNENKPTRLSGMKINPEEFRSKGLLLLANMHTFHPLGYALAVAENEDGSIHHFEIMGDGTEPWHFEESDQVDNKWTEAKNLLEDAKIYNTINFED